MNFHITKILDKGGCFYIYIEEILKESQICGYIVKSGREKYHANGLGHGSFLLSLSAIEKKLQNLDRAGELKKSGLEILMNCIGKENTFTLLKNELNK